jgi:hypothetical protein
MILMSFCLCPLLFCCNAVSFQLLLDSTEPTSRLTACNVLRLFLSHWLPTPALTGNLAQDARLEVRGRCFIQVIFLKWSHTFPRKLVSGRADKRGHSVLQGILKFANIHTEINQFYFIDYNFFFKM